MKGIPVVFLLVIGLVAASQAWKDYSPEDSEDYSSEEIEEQDADLYGGLQDLRGFSDDSEDYLEDAQLDELQELRGINDDYVMYPGDVSSYDRNRRSRGGNLRSSMRKITKSVLRKKSNTQQESNNDDVDSMLASVVDDNLTYVTHRPLPAQDRNEPIPRSLAEQVLQIMRNINGVDYDFVIPMSSIECSSSYPTLGRHMPYSSSQLAIKMDVNVNTGCSYFKSSSINKASTTASVTFSMSPEPHFIITKIVVEPETDIDFRGSAGSQNNPLDTILARSGQFIKMYLHEGVKEVFKSLKRSG